MGIVWSLSKAATTCWGKEDTTGSGSYGWRKALLKRPWLTLLRPLDAFFVPKFTFFHFFTTGETWEGGTTAHINKSAVWLYHWSTDGMYR